MVAVQSYRDSRNDVVMTKAQDEKYSSLRGVAKRNYANRLELGQSVG
jgi:hypothetical protein